MDFDVEIMIFSIVGYKNSKKHNFFLSILTRFRFSRRSYTNRTTQMLAKVDYIVTQMVKPVLGPLHTDLVSNSVRFWEVSSKKTSPFQMVILLKT